MSNSETQLIYSNSAVETKCLGAALAAHLQPGDAVVLNGDLGAGKTQFVQGVAEALGVAQQVTSPTFNILLSYAGEHFPLNHFDLYRLESAEELDDIGYWEVLENGGATFIEWGDKFPEDMPDDYLELSFSADTEGVRTLAAYAHGARSAQLLQQWREHITAV